MDIVQDRIAAYRRIKPDPRGECYGKCRIVEELEDHLDDDRVLTFFLDIIDDGTEHDLARVEALKILQLWDPPSDTVRDRVGQRLARVLTSEEDVLVQQWEAIAAKNFIETPEVLAAVTTLLADPRADLAVRHSCLTAVQFLRAKQTASILRPLIQDKELGVSVRRILSEIKEGS